MNISAKQIVVGFAKSYFEDRKKDTEEKHIKKLWHIRYDILFNFASASLEIVSFTGLNFLLNQSTESKDEQKNKLKKCL